MIIDFIKIVIILIIIKSIMVIILSKNRNDFCFLKNARQNGNIAILFFPDILILVF